MKFATLSLVAAAVVALGSVAGSMTAAVAQSSAEPASAAAARTVTIQAGDADGAFVTPVKFSEPTGAALYKRVCAGCHMPDAKGSTAAGFYPALAGNGKLAANGYPLYVVLHGMNGMPAVGKMMTDQQVADVVNYVRTHFGNKYKDAVTAADAKAAH
ncbi:MAG TPA: cytochrome c [Sphingobium sp.]|uniref:c-type cytochrome n=1 Tax=Sphingobium sp. TaxID=1912891 RepID=UPI002ED5B26F